MSHVSRISSLASIVALAVAPTLWATQSPQYMEEKQEMVRSAFQGSSMDLSSQMLRDSIHRAHTLTAIEIDSSLERPQILIHLTADPLYRADIEDGTFVIDLYDTIAKPHIRTASINTGNVISSSTTQLRSVHPQFITRVSLPLSAATTYKIDARGGRVRVTFTPETLSPTPEKLLRQVHTAQARRSIASSVVRGTLEESYHRADLSLNELRGQLSASIKDSLARLRQLEVTGLTNELGSLKTSEANNSNASQTHTRKIVDAHTATFRGLVQAYLQARSTARENLKTLDASIQNRVSQQKMQLQANLTNLPQLAQLVSAANDEFRNESAEMARLLKDALRKDAKALALFNTLQSEQNAVLSRLHVETEPSSLDKLDTHISALQKTQTKTTRTLTTLQKVDYKLAKLSVGNDGQNALLLDQDTPTSESSTPPGPRTSDQNRPTAKPEPQTLTRIEASGVQVTAAENAGMLQETTQSRPLVIEAEVVSDAQITERQQAATPQMTSTMGKRVPFHLYNPNLPADKDPLRKPVDIDFVEMDLSTVVGLLARRAGINVMATETLAGSVTANFQDIPLGQALEAVLRLHNLGIVEEAGLYRITSYEEAVASRRLTKMISLKNASAIEVEQSIEDLITGTSGSNLISVSANASTNILMLSGPSELVAEFEPIVYQLDIAPSVIPTVTVSLKLNYSEPDGLIAIIQPILTENGTVSADIRGRHLVVTDLPIQVEEVRQLVADLDIPVKQVSISAMIVDAVLTDDAQTGIDWTLNAIQSTDRDGNVISDLQSLEKSVDFTTGPPQHGVVSGINLGSQLLFNILTGDFDITAAIAAQVRSENAELLSNPTLLTLENKIARIVIAQEIPYQELTQTTTGPPIATTEFKEVGTVLEVLVRVTHNDEIIAEVNAKQSDTKGVAITGVPPEDKREAQTNVRLKDGQTIYIGGLRRFDDELTVRKVPLFGDIPLLGALFKSTGVTKEKTELLVFLTCHIMPETMPDLTPYEKSRFDELGAVPEVPDATRELVKNIVNPKQRDPFYKWRRSK